MIAMALERVARNVADLDRAVAFYAALGFEPSAQTEDPELARLLGLATLRRVRMRQHDREIELSQCFPAGAPCRPQDANIVRFQHIALLTEDIRAAYARALGAGAEPISTSGPVQLPAASGGVTAVKFRDPDGHPLEFIEKPGAGYDHSAISVADSARSIAFYGEIGLALAGRQRNHGPEQDALDALAGADVDVVTLRPRQSSPHVELLGYRHPGAIAANWNLNDICADRLVFRTQEAGLHLRRDPDGHVILLQGG